MSFAALALFTCATLSAPSAPIGARLADWSLPRADTGVVWSLAEQARDAKVVVVVFLGTECPISNADLPTLAKLHQDYSSKDVLFVGINSNRQDAAAEVAKHAREHGVPFVVLKDHDSVLADRFAAKRTPEAFVLDGTRVVRYRGRIDDRHDKGVQRPTPQHRDLVDAIDAVLAGKEVVVAVTESAGCPIGRKNKPKATAKQDVTYCKQIARIVQTHCQTCHRTGEAAPFAMMNYADVSAWAEAMREALHDQRMPPWNADPKHGKFANARGLSAAERADFETWVDAGCPEGKASDLPEPRSYVQGWRIGTPDVVLSMNKEMQVPAQAPSGGVSYKYFYAGEPFAEDKWIQAIEARPGNRAVVHHIIAYLVPPIDPKAMKPRGPHGTTDGPGRQLAASFDGSNPDGFGQLFLSAYVPGDVPVIYPAGRGKKVAKGSRIVFEMHYTPNGTACADRSSVGIVWAKEKPTHEVHTRAVTNERFLIPPFASNYKVVSETVFDRPATVLTLSPHMHLRGKDFQYRLHKPDGGEELLLSVPKYDFNWQISYALAEPLEIAAGSRFVCTAHFDNSSGNPNNPNPWKLVGWGQQTWDEMMIGFIDYYYVDGKPR